MKRTLLICLTLLLFAGPATFLRSQVLWPGDINDNGIVNGVDLLYLGVAFGTAGPPRAGATTDWTGQSITTLWPEFFADGLNYAYADCDGNGFIDSDDLDDAIEDNYGLTHGALSPDGFTNAPPGTAPMLELVPSATLVEEGATVTIDLILGTADFPVTEFYGIALKYHYTTGLLADDDGLEYETETTPWINPDGSQLLELSRDDEDSGTGELSITRTNQLNATDGAGKIGTLSIVVEDIIVGLSIDTFRLTIDSILMITREFNVLPVVPDTVEIIIARDTALVTAHTLETPPIQWSVFPNPNAGDFFVTSERPIERIQLLDSRGRPAPHQVSAFQEKKYRIVTRNLPPGIYCLLAEVSGRILSKKIIITPEN